MKVKYSPDAREKLHEIKKSKGNKIVSSIMNSIKLLRDNPYKCPSIERMLGIKSPYYFLHVKQNCIFYKVENDVIYVADIYSERENFMWKMFGINLRTEDSVDFWGE